MDLKKEYIKTFAGLLFIGVLYFVITYFKFNMYQTYGLILASMVLFSIIGKNFTIKTFCINAVYLALFLILVKYLAGYGFFLSVAFISGYILFKRRKKYMEVKYYIEERIWGKPLKEYVKDNEKPPKAFYK